MREPGREDWLKGGPFMGEGRRSEGNTEQPLAARTARRPIARAPGKSQLEGRLKMRINLALGCAPRGRRKSINRIPAHSFHSSALNKGMINNHCNGAQTPSKDRLTTVPLAARVNSHIEEKILLGRVPRPACQSLLAPQPEGIGMTVSSRSIPSYPSTEQ